MSVKIVCDQCQKQMAQSEWVLHFKGVVYGQGYGPSPKREFDLCSTECLMAFGEQMLTKGVPTEGWYGG